MLSMKKWFVVAVVSLVLGAPAQAAVYGSLEDLAQGEVFAADPMFDSVGFMYTKLESDGLWRRAGSGVLIDPEWVLVAGHSLLLGGGIDDTAEVRFYLGNDLFQGPTEVVADEWYAYPGYANDPVGEGVDLGLVHLSQPVIDVDPAVLFTGEDQRDTLMYMAGYGYPGVVNEPLGNFDGLKRAGSALASNFGGDIGWSSVEDHYWVAPFLFDDVQPLEWLSSPGDSGGGWFADIDGEMQLMGINHGHVDTGMFASSLAVRTSLYTDWINEVTQVPEPSSIVILGSGMLGLLGGSLRRRRRTEA